MDDGTVFANVKYRPITPPSLHQNAVVDASQDVAIVVQGPIREEDDFTVNTVDWYRELFPRAQIIVSTWADSNASTLSALRRRECEVVINSFPDLPGPYNVNLQILSTHAGLEQALNAGMTFALKTRSDQRLHNKQSLSFMKSILETFPIHESHRFAQRERILTTSLGSFLYRIYGLTDMLQFGNTEDLLNFWASPFDDRVEEEIEPRDANSLRELALRRKGEVFLMEAFLRRSGSEIDWSLRGYWRAVAERFVVVDAGSLDLFWPKYSDLEDRWADYTGSPSHAPVDMATWLSLYSGRHIADERILDLPLSEVGPVLSTENSPERWSMIGGFGRIE